MPDEPITVTLSRNGWIRSRQGHGLDASQFAYKAGDAPLAMLETRTVNPVVMLDTQGRAYTIRAAEIPGGRGDGVPVTTLIELQPGAKVVAGDLRRARAEVPGRRQRRLRLRRDAATTWCRRSEAGKAFMTLEPDEEPIAPVALAAGLDHVAALSSRGRLLVFPLAEMREVPRGRGVIIMGLDGEETLEIVGLATARKVILLGTNRLGRADRRSRSKAGRRIGHGSGEACAAMAPGASPCSQGLGRVDPPPGFARSTRAHALTGCVASGRHLIEQPTEACCAADVRPVSATSRMALNSSRAAAGSGERPDASSRPR